MATITVTNGNSSGPGSLSDAIATANSASGDDRIIFDPNLKGFTIDVAGRIQISNDRLEIDGDVDGDGIADLTIRSTGDAGTFAIDPNSELALESINITRSDVTQIDTRAIENARYLSIRNSVLRDFAINSDGYFPNAVEALISTPESFA